MTQRLAHRRAEMIPIDQIDVVNPRVRSEAQHREIIHNIETVGLKRPISVSPRKLPDGTVRYRLICGQGRLEAYRLLDQSEIPAFVDEVSDEEGLLMSLVENVARRSHRPIEMMREIGRLIERGHTAQQVADRIGTSLAWVQRVSALLSGGEERLLAAVESGLIPLNVAGEIARSAEADIQYWLTNAYESGSLRGRRLSTVRKLLDARSRYKKGIPLRKPHGSAPKKLTSTDLRRIYEQEAARQRLVGKKASFANERLIFITEAFRDLLGSAEFVAILKEQGVASMPTFLKDRISAAPQ